MNQKSVTKGKLENYKYVEIKFHNLKQAVDQKRNHREIRKNFKVSRNENSIQNLWDTAKAVLRGKLQQQTPT